MLNALKKLQEQKALRKNYQAVLDEMEKNLETFYVIDQRQFVVAGFTLSAWEKAKAMDFIKNSNEITQYAARLIEFNQLFKAHKEYEAWYVSDVKNKNPENAKKLHGMKHELDSKLKGMEALIITAGQTLEKEMVRLGLLTL